MRRTAVVLAVGAEPVNLRGRVVMLANGAFLALVIYASAKYIVPVWNEFDLTHRYQTLPLRWLCSAVGLFLLQYLAVFGAWCCILKSLGASRSVWPLYRAFALSLLPKYIPGKLAGQGVRVGMASKAGVPARITAASLVWEMALALLSVVVVACLGLVFGTESVLEGSSQRVLIALMIIALAMGAILVLPVIGLHGRRWLHLDEVRRAPLKMALVLGIYLGSWFLSTAAHWTLARAVAPLPANLIPHLLVALCVSWGVGMLSVFAPAGLGVREGILFLFVRGWMGSSSAMLFVVLSRLCAFLVEVVLTLVAAIGPSASGLGVSIPPVASRANPPLQEGHD